MTSSLRGRCAAQLRHSGDAFKAGNQVFTFNDLPEGRYAAQLRRSGNIFKAEILVFTFDCSG